ncbi:cytidine deaminase, partial [Vibrio anguillarum]|nr:cytidine deaminase [Vibrio anguillarum]
VTPTFDEFAMFMAFSSSLRSADLSRQVGAVMTKNKNIIATGANDIPQAGGGLYWPEYDSKGERIVDKEGGRDWKRGYDSNAHEKKMIINDILDTLPDDEHKEPLRKLLSTSRIKDITEYGRVVHAEMEA